MSPKYKLVYFNLRGRGELIRLIFHACGVTFEDVRVEFSDWPALKPKTPDGTLPYLEIDGHAYGESLPLARYIARKYHLVCKNELDQLLADITLSHIDEIRNCVSRARNDRSLTDAQKADIETKVKTVLLPKLLKRMEENLTKNKSGYLFGGELSYADLGFYDLIETPLKEAPKLLDSFPKICDHRKKIEGYPRLSKYLTTRPDTQI